MDSNASSKDTESSITNRNLAGHEYTVGNWAQESPWQPQANFDFAATTCRPTQPEEPNDVILRDAQPSTLNLTPLSSNIADDVVSPDVVSSDDGWNVPAEVAIEMIDLFFVHIQPWLPLMHRPLFYERFTQSDGQTRKLMSKSKAGPDAAFMFNSMFALAARFSTGTFFENSPVLDRDQAFANEAATIKDGIIKTIEEPTLAFVKGCIMLAFYYFTAGELAPGSILTSVCIRFAYDLGLNEVDEDQPLDDGTQSREDLGYSEAWIRKEELRRLWWSIWELEIFVATLSRQLYTIERADMKVFLPVSDQQWFSGTPINSSLLDHLPKDVWRSLQGSPNQDPRAWYLISNHLMSCIALAGRQQFPVSSVKKAELESALCCLKLALPTDFQLRSLYLDGKDSMTGNWIICTHLMVLACETLFERLACPQPGQDDTTATDQAVTRTGERIRSYLVHIGQTWPSKYIPSSNPFMSCCVVVPGSILAQPPDSVPQCHEVAKLILTHYSRYWKLGHSGLRLMAAIRQGVSLKPSALGPKERDMMKRFSLLLPPSSHREASQGSPSTSDVQNQDSSTLEIGPETLWSPNLDNFYTSDLFQWPFEMWTNP